MTHTLSLLVLDDFPPVEEQDDLAGMEDDLEEHMVLE
jgi:hypothetical protein